MRRLLTVLARLTIVFLGLGPGLVLPLVVAAVLPHGAADRILLLISIASTMTGIAVLAVEANVIAVAGALLRTQGFVTTTERNRVIGRVVRWAWPVALGGGAVLGLIYYQPADSPWSYWFPTTIATLAPMVGCVGAVSSGMLIASGRSTLPILTQGFRGVLPILILLIFPSSPLAIVAGLVIGESVRLVILNAAAHNLMRSTVLPTEAALLDASAVGPGIWWQAIANTVGDLGPVATRGVLARTAVGAVTAFEISEKLAGASMQVIYNVGLLPRLGAWSTALPTDRYALFRRDVQRLILVSIVLNGVGVALLITATILDVVPTAWSLGILWGCIALAGGPAQVATGAASRYLVLIREQRLTPMIVSGGAVVQFIGGILLLEWIGPVGPVVSLATVRWIVTFTLLFAARWHEERRRKS